MKTRQRLLSIAAIIIACTLDFATIAQTPDVILKWSGTTAISTVTPIYEDATNFRIGIGTSFPSNTLTVSGDADITGNLGIGTNSPQQNLSVWNGANIDQSDANSGSITNGLRFGSGSGEGIGSRRSIGTNQYGLDFYTASINRMTITVGGNVGIGTIIPGQLLTVSGGNVDITTANKSYMINNTPVLWHNNLPTSIYVGVGAGNGTTTTGLDNTLVGYQAGGSLTDGHANTYMGYQAGKTHTGFNDITDPGNVAIGYQAMYSNIDLVKNTAVGYQALYSSNSCIGGCFENWSLNTAVGHKALYSSQAYGGTVVGYEAGYSNTLGCGIVAMGEEAMHKNTIGNYNVAIGAHSLHENTELGHNVAVGHWALFDQNYTPGAPPIPGVKSYNVAVGNWSLQHNDPTTDDNGRQNTALEIMQELQM